MNQASDILKSYLDQKVLPPAFLLIGSSREKLLNSAKNFASEMMIQKDPHVQVDKIKTGNHPDFYLYAPSSKTGVYTIEQIREITKLSQLYPHEAPLQFFVLTDAERMQEAASNALLKTLEEPSEGSHFILIAQNKDLLLPTLASRLQKISFKEELENQREKKHLQLLTELLKKWPHFSYNDLHLVCQAIQEELGSEETEGFSEQLFCLNQEKEALFLQIERWAFDLEPKPFSIKKISQILEKARLGLGRSIKLSICLESLLLNFI